MSDVAERVKKVAARILGITEDEITDESTFREDLGATSIQSIELVAAFEEEFDIDMDPDEALAVEKISDAAEFIRKHVDDQG